MVTKINTRVVLDNKYKFVIIDIAKVGTQEIALAVADDGAVDKDPKITYFTETVDKDGSVFLKSVTDKKTWDEATKKFKIRMKV